MKKTVFLLGILCGLSANAQNWSLTGNSGTSPASNFLGTTDNQSLVFKTNNAEWLKITPTGRLIFRNLDTDYGWSHNLFLGGGNETSTGVGNLTLGLGAFISNTTGSANTAIGANALRSNTTGTGNVSLGSNALFNETTGSYNVGVGLNVLNRLTTGSGNTAVGFQALHGGSASNIVGSDNTAIGKSTLQGLGSSSSSNTAIGSNSFIQLRSGSNNISVGFNNITTELFNANNNIYIGNNLSNKITPPSNELNIGNWIVGHNGTIGIGQFTNALPSDGIASDGKKYKLFVKDGIKTEKVKVDISSENGWADYVFADNYNLMSLKDVERFININKHLPEVPSESEAIKYGVELKEMNILLLKKIEELTLYIIKQNKQIENQNTTLENQNVRLEKLERNQNK